MENIVTIQIIEGATPGFLDIQEGSVFPLNFAISDIRDLSSRTGTFSKTITLSGSKNNCRLLNNYYAVNISAGTFDVNKKTKVALIQNGVVLRDNCYLTLLKIVKKQNYQNQEDDSVYFEVQVKDELGDFFKEVGNKELIDLDGFDNFNHIYNKDAVVDSFQHTQEDGYKYILPWIDDSEFNLAELLPGIYTKQIFDRIHEQNGFSYTWGEMTGDTIQFDKLIEPYSGDKKKMNEDYIEEVTVSADEDTLQNFVVTQQNTGAAISNYTGLIVNNNIVDSQGWYDGYQYLNTFTLAPPNKLIYDVQVEYEVYVVNTSGGEMRTGFGAISPNTLVDTANGFRLDMKVMNINSQRANHNLQPTPAKYVAGDDASLVGQDLMWNDGEYINLRGRILVPFGGQKLLCSGNSSFTIPVTNIHPGQQLNLRFNLQTRNQHLDHFWKRSVSGAFPLVNVNYRVDVKSVKVSIKPDASSGLLPGSQIILKSFLPQKVKQSEFLKTIYQKFNLYVETDKNNPNHLIYTTRDKFYDDGEIKNWSKKLDKYQNQELYFLPEITTKKVILTYKDDENDSLLSVYRGEVGETFGQVTVEFANENIKGEERREEIFAPTINIATQFGAILPSLPPNFKMEPRILLDGGNYNCGNYRIKQSDSDSVTLNYYPSISMFDAPFNPQFSIEYAQSDFYGYNAGTLTQNTLYVNHWRRTLAQIDSGKMLKAYFYLDEFDIQNLKLNDKIIIGDEDNASIWYINAVIDYDANANKATQVELLSIEDDLRLPRIGRIVKPDFPGVVFNEGFNTGVATPVPSTPNKPGVIGGFFTDALSSVIKERNYATSVFATPGIVDLNLGKNNIIGNNFRGLVIGDNITADVPGIFFGNGTGQTQITTSSVQTGQIIVDGVDVVQELETIQNEISGITGNYLPLSGGQMVGPITYTGNSFTIKNSFNNSNVWPLNFGEDAGSGNTGDYQIAMGQYAGMNNSGYMQVSIGRQSGIGNTAQYQAALGGESGIRNIGDYQTSIGYFSGFENRGFSQVAIGYYSGHKNSGYTQTAVGQDTGYNNRGNYQAAFGYGAGQYNIGNYQVALGIQSGLNNTGFMQTAVGPQTGNDNSGDYQISIGNNAGRFNTGHNNINIGINAGNHYSNGGANSKINSSDSIFFGQHSVAYSSGASINEIVIGNYAIGNGSNTVTIGSSGITNTYLKGVLNINQLGTGTSINTLGIDSSGNVVASTGSTSVNKYVTTTALSAGNNTITHNLGDADVIVQIQDNTGKMFIPNNIDTYNTNSVNINVNSGLTAKIIIIK